MTDLPSIFDWRGLLCPVAVALEASYPTDWSVLRVFGVRVACWQTRSPK